MNPTFSRNAPIALFDSGAGGIGVLREVQKLLPGEQLLYFGDSQNAPYGEKTTHEIRQLVLAAADRLIPRSKALVLACNTATAVAAEDLRSRYPDFPIIGMEPALCPALRVSAHPRIAVLATAATLREQKFAALRKKCEKSATVWEIPAPGIVRLVEQGLADSPMMDAYIKSLLAPLPSLPDAIVLGCTHFPFAKRAFRRVAGSRIPILDGSVGTARQLVRRLAARNALSPHSGSGSILLTTSRADSLPLLTKMLFAP